MAGMGSVTDDNEGHQILYSGPYRPRWSVLGLSWAQHRLRVLIRLSHVKNCSFFLCEVEFLFLYFNCVEEKK